MRSGKVRAMKLTIRRASREEISEVMSWQYDAPYEFYSGDGEPPLNPERFFAARDERGELVGFFYFERRGEALFYGLGLRPELTGKGLGLDFVHAGLRFARRRYRPTARVILDVASFNERAIKVYERAGFEVTGRHVRGFDRWGEVEFVDMELRQSAATTSSPRSENDG
jgi:RimJ/RimL family protein N-acetyltransferase